MNGLGYPLSRMYRTSRADLVDATEIREHITRLESVGMSVAMIARAAGITDTQVSFYKAGQATTRRAYAEAVLSVDGRPSKHQAFVLNVGAVRRLRGLAVMGFTLAEVGDCAGVTYQWVSAIRRAPGPVTWESHERVRVAFEALGSAGSSAKVRRMALRAGWVHPFGWVDIDDPFEVAGRVEDSGLPDPVAVERLVAGVAVSASAVDRRAAFEVLLGEGMTVSGAAVRVGINYRTAVRLSRELDGVAA